MATFLESPRFPDNIAFGATVGPTYLTVLSTVYSGRDGRIAAWTQSRVRFEVGRRSMNAADTATLDAFFRAVKGRAYGFRIKDWTDFSVTTGNGVLTPSGAPGRYQLGKLYTTGVLSETRNIQKPVAGSPVVNLNASPLAGTAYAVDSTTGLVTLTQASFPSANVTGITVGASTVVNLASAISGLGVGGMLAFNGGFGGADQALLNGQAFQITALTGAQYTLAVTTTGKAITTGSAIGTRYPQGADVLAWAGQFDVPARFDVDEMKKQVMDRSGGDLIVDWGSIPIVEIRV
ncbi:DUF2460 domain-containing protein [Paraburkholderia terrae]|uniref:DUF2460 domain-containing protein n=1 Tax=Paraburkholderia terrae TaxID=311230 RepID=UPI00296AB1A8|nr:DUF2460 domain-containing protein [Paraburkholderia terrae]MDW3655141.1 DUF2460 domain-containing protein [Paraburkholderia terrae]